MSITPARAHDPVANTNALQQSYLLRGWLTFTLTQMVQAEMVASNRVAELELELKRLRTQADQATAAIQSLRQTIQAVDDVIRRRASGA